MRPGCRHEKDLRVEKDPHSLIAPFDECIHFGGGHGRGPVRIDDLDLALERAESSARVSGLVSTAPDPQSAES
jgi:hypothetical protein